MSSAGSDIDPLFDIDSVQSENTSTSISRTGSQGTGTNSCEPSTTPPPFDNEIREPSTTIFGDIPTTDSDAISRALVEGARASFDVAREAYWAGQPGPYILEGRWSLATFEALASTLESKWRLCFEGGRIILYGDPKDVHERVTELIASEVLQGIAWNTHAETPAILQGFRGQRLLLQNVHSTTRTWKLSPASPTVYCKEADGLFIAETPTSAENGLAIEIAHGNEDLPTLCREIINWTSGEGERALFAVGFKVHTKAPYQRDPQLRLVVRDSTPSSTSLNCKVYDFGNGSQVAPRRNPHSGPPTMMVVEAEHLGKDCYIQHLIPLHREIDKLIVEVPIGAAIFHDLKPDAFSEEFGLILTNNFVNDLKRKSWCIDLGYLRYCITKIIEKDAA